MGKGKNWSKREQEIFLSMASEGRSYDEIAERIGKSCHSVKIYAKMTENVKTQTKCWSCRYATGRIHPSTRSPCPWTGNPPEPVDGWNVLNGKVHNGVVVVDCPLFAEG